MRLHHLLAPALIAAALAGCGTRTNDRDEATDEGGIGDPDSDSANLRAVGMREWYTESKSPDREVWPRDYRYFLLDTARAERERWADLMPGAKNPSLISGAKWVNLGPTQAMSGANGGGGTNVVDSGRITAIVPDGTSRLFIATAGGGVWRRQNNTWAPLTETVGTLSCGALAMDPSNHDHLYLGLGDAFDGTGVGLLVSTNGGTSWSDPILLGDSTKIQSIMVDPSTPSIVMVATDKGLYRSTNAGASFAPVNIATGLMSGPFVWSIAWTGGHGFVLSLGDLLTDSPITENGQIWYSSDDGASWMKASGVTATAGVGRITIASAPSARATLYALAGVPNADSTSDLADIFKSADGGKTWTGLGAAAKKFSNTSGKVGGLLNQQGWYNQLVLVDPNDPNTAYFGGALTLAKTTDGGSTFRAMTDWLGQSRTYVHADFHAGALDATGLYVGTDGGLFQSTDGATSFSSSLNNGLVTHLLYSVGSSPAAPAAVLGGMQDNGTRLRSGSTSDFDEVIGGDGFGAAISRTNAQNMLGSLYYDQIQSSNDGGNNWGDATGGIAEAGDSQNAPFITRIIPWEGAQSTGNEVYTFSNTKVYKSTNFGGSWTALPTAVTSTASIRNMGVAASDSKIIGVVGSGGNVWLSKDGGQSWANVATGKLTDPMALPNSDRSLSSIHFDVSNPNTVYVTSVAPEASVNHVWKSTDFGAHWASIDGNGLPAGVPINVIKSDPVPGAMPGKVLYAGTHMGVYRSQDGGATWARFGAGMPLVSVTDLYVSPDESIVRAATFGRGFWELQAVANDFSINANPTSVTITPGASGTSTISTAVTAGKAETIAFSIGGLPTGVTAAFSPTSAMAGASSTLTLTAGANAAPGTYPLTITGTSPSIAHTVGLSLVISGTGDFTIAVAPATLALDPGSNGTATVSTTIASGSAQAITLSISGLPDGVTAMFDNPNIQAGGSATLTVAAASTAAAGTATVTITGTGPSTTHAATLALTINPGMNGSGSGTGSGSGSGSGSGNGAEGNHGGCCSAGGSREAAGNLALALAVVAIGATRRRRRR